jgi:transposase
MEKRGKTAQTGYKWVKDWNEKGFDGLFRKEGSGRNSKLSDLQFKVLRENIISKGLTSVQEVKMEIKNEFGVVYSERHLRRLIFDLGLEDMIISNHIK